MTEFPEATARLSAALSNRYRIERELGRGGMARVYLAEDVRHHRHVAVKVLHPELAALLGHQRFLREVQISARLQHPHILTLIESGETGDPGNGTVGRFLYYVMPFVDGGSLRMRLTREHELPVADVVRIMREVADALAEAHAHGVVHRDIKPDNVLLRGQHVVVTDFGIAKAVTEAAAADQGTSAGVTLGTPAYMAPEQAAGDPAIDHRADIYALGVMAYEMLTGAPPFSGATPQSVLAAHMTRTPVPVASRRAEVPAALAVAIMRCLEKHPPDRWQTANDLLAQLDGVLAPARPGPATGRLIRLMTVDDHPIFRGGLAALIGAYPDLQLVAEAVNGREAVERYRQHKPDVTLMDLSMPVMGGVDAIAAITAEFPDARIIALTTWDGDADIHRALEAGARGYLLKDVVSDDVAEAIRQVHAGGRSIPSEVAERLAAFTPRIDLTEREAEVLVYMAKGLSNKEIGALLGRTEGTIKVHVLHILQKLHAADRTEAVTIGLQRGIFHLP